MPDRARWGSLFYDLSPRSPLMGPPIPEGFDVWWPEPMLRSEPGLITTLNLDYLRIKRSIANSIAGAEIVPGDPYPRRTWRGFGGD